MVGTRKSDARIELELCRLESFAGIHSGRPRRVAMTQARVLRWVLGTEDEPPVEAHARVLAHSDQRYEARRDTPAVWRAKHEPQL